MEGVIRTRFPVVGFLMNHDRVSVIDGTELPVDWMGKSWALDQGIKYARGEWLLFTDADCTHHPLSLKTGLEFAQSKGINLVSIVPALSRLSLAEKFVMPAFVSLLMVGVPVVSLLMSAFFTAPLPMSLSAIPVAVMVLLGIGSTKLLHIRWMWGFLVPVGLLFYGWIVVVAVVKVRRGALVWSGRRYGR
jgi:glycosyltransferase involved in cell wall biosynthesis